MHLTLVPPAFGSDGGMRFTINGGDTYCVAFGGAAGGEARNAPRTGTPAKLFKVASKRLLPTKEAGCPAASPALVCAATDGRFCDLGDGTVLDVSTGLQWEQKTTSVGSGANLADLHDVDNRYGWAGACSVSTSKLCQPTAAAEALCKAQTPPAWWASGCEQCTGGDGTCTMVGTSITTVWDWLAQVRAASFAGHGDWRLPSEDGCNSCYSFSDQSCTCAPVELETILRCSQPSFGFRPCLPPIFGPDATSDAVGSLSASTSPDFNPFASGAWWVRPGRATGIDKDYDDSVVRAVR